MIIKSHNFRDGARLTDGVPADDDVVDDRDGRPVRVGDLLDGPKRPCRASMPRPVEGAGHGRSTARFRPVEAAPGERVEVPDLLDAETARKDLGAGVGSFMRAAGVHHGDVAGSAMSNVNAGGTRPPFHLVEASLGLGKTQSALTGMIERLRWLRAAGDAESAAVVAVPFHRLSDQIAADVSAMAPELRVVVLRGREAQDPAAPGQTMCRNLRAVREIEGLLLDVEATVCGSCQFKATCPYLAQKPVVADVYIVAHQALTMQPPTESRDQRLDHLIIDESPLDALLYGVEGEPVEIAVGAFATMRATPWRPPGKRSLDAEADLRDARWKLQRAAKANGTGPMARAVLEAAGLTASSAGEAELAEWARKVEDPEAHPATLDHNRTVIRMVRVWRELARLLASNDVETARVRVAEDAEAGLVLLISGLREVSEGFRAAPILMLDATPSPKLLAFHFGKMDAHHVVHAAAPHMTLRQDWSRSYAKSMLIADLTQRTASEDAAGAARRNRRRLVAFLHRHARRMGGTGLVIGNKALVEAMAGDLPSGVAAMHFNALRGMNHGKAVRWVVVVGRTLPLDAAVARTVEATTGRRVIDGMDRDGEVLRRVAGADGVRRVAGRGATHPDPVAAEVLRVIRDAEVMQAVGRARGVNRVADDPVDVLVLGDAVLPDPVEVAAPWAEIRDPGPVEKMLDVGGLALASSIHAAEAYPAIWKTEAAAKSEFRRKGATGFQISKGGLHEVCNPVVELAYRVPRCSKRLTALIDPARHPDPVAALLAAVPKARDVEVVAHAAPTAADAPRPAGPEMKVVPVEAPPPPEPAEAPLVIAGPWPPKPIRILIRAADARTRGPGAAEALRARAKTLHHPPTVCGPDVFELRDAPPRRPAPRPRFGPDAEAVLAAVRTGHAAMTALARKTGLDGPDLARALAELERAGHVRPEPPVGLWRPAEPPAHDEGEAARA